MRYQRNIITFILGALITGTASAGTLSPDVSEVLQNARASDRIDVIVTLNTRADLSAIQETNLATRRAKIITALQQHANQSGQPLLNWLSQQDDVAGWKILWMINSVATTMPAGKIRGLANRPDVANVRLDAKVKIKPDAAGSPATPEWNVNAINATALWDMGYTGQGVVVATMDTGVDPDHPDLTSRWRGGDNSWFDPYGEHATPYDRNGHGTQTTGLIVGGDAGGSSIGVAPGAQWIAVKIFNDADTASLSGIHAGFQWLLDPDSNPGSDDSPDIVNNSWNLQSTLNTCESEFQSDIDVLKQAEIAVVFSSGNTGPNDATSLSPANNNGSLATGAVDETMTIGYFSGRGPSACSGDIYPRLSAPGMNVRTADLTFGGIIPDSYVFATGTSFAVPHVAGSMALLKSAATQTSVTDLENALEQSAVDAGSTGEDNAYGWGIVDVAAAYDVLTTGGGGGQPVDNDGDGVTSESDCNDNDASIYPGASEIKHDGVDQDCNGYDLTIDIVKAQYSIKRDTLSVEATSDLGKSADLVLDGIGAMKWSNKNKIWSLSVRRVGGEPGTVTVSGVEGADTVTTTAK
jgi:serine protease AprX